MHIHKGAFYILIAMENMYWLRESHIAYLLKKYYFRLVTEADF